MFNAWRNCFGMKIGFIFRPKGIKIAFGKSVQLCWLSNGSTIMQIIAPFLLLDIKKAIRLTNGLLIC